jgi:hypothetical protein
VSDLSGGVNLAAAIIGLIELAGQVGTELYLKLKAVGELSADEQANIRKAIDDAISVDADTIARIDAWRVSVGLEPALPPPKPVNPIAPTPPPDPKAGSD